MYGKYIQFALEDIVTFENPATNRTIKHKDIFFTIKWECMMCPTSEMPNTEISIFTDVNILN